MKIEVAVAELKGVRLALAFVDARLARPGVGDALIARLGPYLPPLPLMLVGSDGRCYAAFQTHEFAARLRRSSLDLFTVDLDAPPPQPDAPAPF
jgi:hypothetical protein